MSVRQSLGRVLQWVGALSLLALLGGGLSGFLVLRGGLSTRDTPSALETWVARTARSTAVPERMKQLKNPVSPTPEVLAEARAHWADHCASCHANNGSGDMPMGRNLFPKAPDMRQAATQSLTDGELYSIIQNGIRLTGMPAWGEPRDDDMQTWGLVAFIRHLPELTAEEEAEMKTLNPVSVHELREQQAEEDFLNQPD